MLGRNASWMGIEKGLMTFSFCCASHLAIIMKELLTMWFFLPCFTFLSSASHLLFFFQTCACYFLFSFSVVAFAMKRGNSRFLITRRPAGMEPQCSLSLRTWLTSYSLVCKYVVCKQMKKVIDMSHD